MVYSELTNGELSEFANGELSELRFGELSELRFGELSEFVNGKFRIKLKKLKFLNFQLISSDSQLISLSASYASLHSFNI